MGGFELGVILNKSGLTIAFANIGACTESYLIPSTQYPGVIIEHPELEQGAIAPSNELYFRNARKFVSRIFLAISSCSRKRLVAIISCFDRIERLVAVLVRIKAAMSPRENIKIAINTSIKVKADCERIEENNGIMEVKKLLI